jgi:hypothetical protein
MLLKIRPALLKFRANCPDPIVRWAGLTLLITAIYSLTVIQGSFWQDGQWSPQTIVQDDARQHVFWMQRWQNPRLFPADPIADYFQSVAPWGYQALYRLPAMLGLPPLLWNKLLPLPLALITSWYSYRFTLALWPQPIAASLSALLLTQNLWLKDDLTAGTARALVYPIFAAFLNAVVRGQLWHCLVSILLMGLCYPQFALVMGGILLVRSLRVLARWLPIAGRLWLRRNWRSQLRLPIAGLILVSIVLSYYAFHPAAGPAIAGAIARTMPEFREEGRAEFFVRSPLRYWLWEKRSGLLMRVMPVAWWGMWLLGLSLIGQRMLGKPRGLALPELPGAGILLELGGVAIGLFILAHANLFALYLPGRYPQISLQFISAIAGGIALTALMQALRPRIPDRYHPGLVGVCATLLLLMPWTQAKFPKQYAFAAGQIPAIYQFLAQQPVDRVVASLTREADNLPTFAGRSVWVSREYALPYHQDYYDIIRQRTIALMTAHYSPDRQVLRQFIQTSGVDFWLVDRRLLQVSPLSDQAFELQWLRQFPPAVAIAADLKQGKIPALVALTAKCRVMTEGDYALLDSTCLLR